MKIVKKIGLGLAALIALASISLFAIHGTLAAGSCNGYAACGDGTSGPKSITSSTGWTLEDQCHIEAYFGNRLITFTDNKCFDGNHRYDAPAGTFCSGGGGGSGQSGIGAVYIDDWSQVTSGAKQLDGYVDIDYWNPALATGNCVNWGNWTIPNPPDIANNITSPILSGNSWLWTSNNDLISADGSTTLIPVTPDNKLYGISQSSSCNGGTVVYVPGGQGGSSGYEYSLGGIATSGVKGAPPSNVNASSDKYIGSYYQNASCYVHAGSDGSAPVTIESSGQNPAGGGSTSQQCNPSDTANIPSGYTCTGNCQPVGSQLLCTLVASSDTTGSGGNSPDTCSLKASGASLAWFMCPALEMADAFATNLMNAFESQLNFCVDHGGVTCAAPTGTNANLGNQNAQVKTAWTVIKDLASAIIVVVLLIMVFSQAIGSGPFDAYTVRKMLPRLVAAVILIQVSWYLCAFIVDLFNDIGNGLADLLYAPFGGASQLDFGSLLTNAHIGTGQGILIGWFGLGAAIALGVAFLPTIAFAGLVVILTLLTGLTVLIFRKTLIILLIMLSPLAIVFWVLPGNSVQKLWKMWQDNFIKVLTMFPLIVSIIAAGRIFAKITGTTGNGTFLNFWFVVVGYFLPLALLPRAFKWGGSIMSAAGNQITSLQRTAQGAAKQPLKQFVHDVYTGKRADQYDPTKSALGLSVGRKNLFGKRGGPKIRPTFSMNGRAYRRLQSGHFLPTNRSRNMTLKTGEEWSSARTAEALAYEQKFSRIHQERGVTEKEAARWNKTANDYARKRGYKGPPLDLFKARPNGVGAGKWSALALFWDAYAKGDAPLQKAIADHLIRSKSGLEFRNPNFVAPYFDEKTGKLEALPFFGHPLTVDRAFKEPDLYSTLASMGGDFPPHNTPFGGNGGFLATGYQKVYKRGIRWIKDSNGRVIENQDYNPDIARDFGITVGQDRANAWSMSDDLQPRTADNPNGQYNPEAWAAHYAQASYDDAVNNMAMGGSMGGAFMNMLIHGSQHGFAPGEGANPMPIRQAAWALVEATRTQQGRDKLTTIYTDPSTREIAETMVRTAGITKFKDTFGVEHDFSIQELWSANTAAEERMKRGERPTMPGRTESLGTTGPGGGFVSIYNAPPPPPPPSPPPAVTPAPVTPPPTTPSAPAAPVAPAAPAPASVVAPTSTIPASTTYIAATHAAAQTTPPPTVTVDLGSAGAQLTQLTRAAEAMNEAAYHMRRTAATQERAARRIQGIQPDEQGTMNVEHHEERDENQGNNPGQNT